MGVVPTNGASFQFLLLLLSVLFCCCFACLHSWSKRFSLPRLENLCGFHIPMVTEEWRGNLNITTAERINAINSFPAFFRKLFLFLIS